MLMKHVSGKRKLLRLLFLIGLTRNGATLKIDQGPEFSIGFTPKDGPLGRSNVIGLIGTFVLKLNGPGHEIIIYFII